MLAAQKAGGGQAFQPGVAALCLWLETTPDRPPSHYQRLVFLNLQNMSLWKNVK